MSDKEYFKRLFDSHYLDEIAFSERKKIFDMFVERIRPRPDEKIVDIGVFCGSTDPKMNFLEMLYGHPEKITAVGIEDASFLESQYSGLKFIRTAPGAALPFGDNQFDIGFCSATIEHVGSPDRQRYFLSEAIRVCKRLFLTTPNRFYPVEFHTRAVFLHWLPKPVFRKIIKCLGLEFYSREDNLNLLDKGELLALVPEQHSRRARVICHRLFGLPSNLILIVEK
ncbi:MAG: methyltransferase domain-containing protein [Candidatus Omnitrophica bacterium]|nr:methyltransferase domain-containing protein [Candidatus Omnitrophota bacterium]MDD5435930.1 methyltransferase domain-containing protein [Candidatus Omnitrophota bacterium]